MLPIKLLVSKFLQKPEIKRQIEAVEVCKIADKILKEAFNISDIKASFFCNKILQIKCSNSSLANEIQLHKEKIKNEINEKLGKELVKDILTRIS